jgi:hypothetical protein
MAHIHADRVWETTTTTGTGALTLLGAVTAYRAFSAVCAANDTVCYCCAHRTANEWEVGIGTFNTTLTRTVILSSSNAGNAVSFSSGTKDVFITEPAGLGKILPWTYAVPGDFRRGAAAILNGEEGLAADFITRTVIINDYSDVLSDAGRPSDIFTFSRSSTGLYVDRDKTVKSASANTMRFDHDLATGVPRGLLIEPARTNILTAPRDLTNAAWTKTNVTAAKDQTGIDGVSNSASKITATAGNGTCLQSVTLSSSARGQSAYVKRITGSGTIEMTMDGGSTWTAVTVTSAWTRVTIPQQTLANPNVGFRIVTNGDAIAVDYVQNEAMFPSSPYDGARSAETLSLSSSLFPVLAARGTMLVEFELIGQNNSGGVSVIMQLDDGTSNNQAYIREGTVITGYDAIGRSGGSSATDTNSAAYGSGIRRMGFAWESSNNRFAADGVLLTNATNGAAPASFTRLVFAGSNSTAIWLRKCAVLTRRVTDAELQAMTAQL